MEIKRAKDEEKFIAEHLAKNHYLMLSALDMSNESFSMLVYLLANMDKGKVDMLFIKWSEFAKKSGMSQNKLKKTINALFESGIIGKAKPKAGECAVVVASVKESGILSTFLNIDGSGYKTLTKED